MVFNELINTDEPDQVISWAKQHNLCVNCPNNSDQAGMDCRFFGKRHALESMRQKVSFLLTIDRGNADEILRRHGQD